MTDIWHEVSVTSLRQETDRVKSFTLSSSGSALPTWNAGAHVRVRLPSGLIRQYSLLESKIPNAYDVAVLNEHSGRGGSKEMHGLKLGERLHVSDPVNQFPLVTNGSLHVLIAGGIGITPILSMARELQAKARDWRLIYCARSRNQTALIREVEQLGEPARTQFIFDNGNPAAGLDIRSLFGGLKPGTHVYVCGPRGLIEAISQAANVVGWPAEDVHWEAFAGSASQPERSAARPSDSFKVTLQKSGMTLEVQPAETILEVVRRAGIRVDSVCEQGYCGSCLTTVIDGIPDHRDDDLLSDQERASNDIMAICCSRSRTPKLVLDL